MKSEETVNQRWLMGRKSVCMFYHLGLPKADDVECNTGCLDARPMELYIPRQYNLISCRNHAMMRTRWMMKPTQRKHLQKLIWSADVEIVRGMTQKHSNTADLTQVACHQPMSAVILSSPMPVTHSRTDSGHQAARCRDLGPYACHDCPPF
jgi:hypothetical protein